MTIKFRWHRGGLEDSLATSVEFESWSELWKVLHDNFVLPLLKANPLEVKIFYCGFDERVNQDLWMVKANTAGMDDFYPLGFIYEIRKNDNE